MKNLVLFTVLCLTAACHDALPPVDEVALAAITAGALVVDVRTADEFSSGHFAGAINIPHESIVEGLRARDISPDQPLVLYCRTGNRSGKAQQALRTEGYTSVSNAGGLEALLQATRTEPTQPRT